MTEERPSEPPIRQSAGEHGSVYDLRFGERERSAKEAVWREIGRFLQRRYIPEWSKVLGVRFVQSDGLRLAEAVPNNYFDVVFMSNYLEHLDSAESVVEQLRVARRVLRVGGRVIVLQPNIKLVGTAYWDFIDHRVPLTAESLVEAATFAGFATHDVIGRFLPYSVKGRLPASGALVRAYLAFPPAWRVMGKQTLYVGERRT
jgi:SAM-dependent methyltransferase